MGGSRQDRNGASGLPLRYHPARLPEFVPRIFAVNPTNTSDLGSWFFEQNMMPLALLARGDLASLRNLPESQKAMPRSSAVLNISENLYVQQETVRRCPRFYTEGAKLAYSL